VWFSALKQLVSRGIGQWYGESYYIATYIRAFDWFHVRWPWMTFEGHFSYTLSFPRPVSQKLYTIRPKKLKLLIRNHTRPTAFRWYDCRWPWRYINVIRLFHIKFLFFVKGVWYGKSDYELLIGNHTRALNFRLVPCTFDDLEGHLKVISVYMYRLSFSRPISQKL